MADFHYQPIFELGGDDTPYRRLELGGVSSARVDGRELLRVEPETLQRLACEALDDISHLLRPGHLAQLRAHPRRPGGVGQRSLRRARAADQRDHRRRGASCPAARIRAPRSRSATRARA